MKKDYKKGLQLALALIVVGQIIFYLFGGGFLEAKYTSRIYATTGIKYEQEDLSKLNEAAHYFGQTIIGWLKFPNFMNQLSAVVELPENSRMSAQIQERQNIIFNLYTKEAIAPAKLFEVRDYIQGKIDGYNNATQTAFILTNFDYEQVIEQKSYPFGATVALLISLVFGLGIPLFLRKGGH